MAPGAASGRTGPRVRPTMSATSVNPTPNRSWSTQAVRSAGLSVSSTTSGAKLTCCRASPDPRGRRSPGRSVPAARARHTARAAPSPTAAGPTPTGRRSALPRRRDPGSAPGRRRRSVAATRPTRHPRRRCCCRAPRTLPGPAAAGPRRRPAQALPVYARSLRGPSIDEPRPRQDTRSDQSGPANSCPSHRIVLFPCACPACQGSDEIAASVVTST